MLCGVQIARSSLSPPVTVPQASDRTKAEIDLAQRYPAPFREQVLATGEPVSDVGLGGRPVPGGR